MMAGKEQADQSRGEPLPDAGPRNALHVAPSPKTESAPPRSKLSRVPPTASASRPKGRHWNILASFVLMVLVPGLVAVWYLYTRAADQYASTLGFSVRREEGGSAIELLGGFTEISSSSSSDTDILFSYLKSQELVRLIDERVNLRAIWSKVDPKTDPVFAFDPSGTIEDLLGHWDRKITIVYDSGTGMIDLRVLAFDPVDAQRIAQAILEECTDMINNLSAIAREDAIKYSRAELEAAVDRLKDARRALTEFRNRTQIVDPSIDTQNQMGLLTTLQQQLAEALIDLDLLRDTTLESDPRVIQLTRRVDVIQGRIDAERRKLGIGTGTQQGETAFATLVGEYEGLIVDREFAEESYTSALATFDAAQAEALKQSRYLAAHIRPTLAEKAQYPERVKLLIIIGMSLMFVWLLTVLIYYSIRDRR